MGLAVVLGTVLPVAALLFVLLALLLWQYRDYKQKKMTRDKLYSKIYVEMYQQQQRQRKTGYNMVPLGTEPPGTELLCQGNVTTSKHLLITC